jgi:hypothetical protein
MLLVNGTNPTARSTQTFAVERFNVLTIDPEFPRRWPQRAVEEPEKSGFTRATRSNERNTLTSLDPHIDTVQRDLTATENLTHSLETILPLQVTHEFNLI